MIAEMRLQFWRDVVEEAPAGRSRAHEVAGPLAGLIREAALPVPLLEAMIEARRHDIWAEPFADEAAFTAHLEATAAGLMWASALALGAPAAAETAVRAVGWAAGLAAWLQAVPELEARGRQPLPDGRPEAVVALARAGLSRLESGRRVRLPRDARPALLPAWQAGALLRLAVDEPGRVAAGRLQLSEFARRGRLSPRGLHRPDLSLTPPLGAARARSARRRRPRGRAAWPGSPPASPPPRCRPSSS